MDRPDLDFYFDVLNTLERLDISYVIIGAFAGVTYGVTRNSIRMGMMFNIIDSTAGRKVDIISLTMEPGYGFALQRRVRRNIRLNTPEPVPVWIARPEDVIVGKLLAWQESRPLRHEMDIRDILIAVKLGEDPEITESFDYTYIDRWAMDIGEDAAALWEGLKQITASDSSL